MAPACFHNVHSIAATFHYDLSVKSFLTVSGGVRHPRAGFVLHISLQFLSADQFELFPQLFQTTCMFVCGCSIT